MSQSIRTRLSRVSKKEQEIHLIANPTYQASPLVAKSSVSRREIEYDYQAPMTSYTLRPNSYWLVVRRNLHRIRFMSISERGRDASLPAFYIGLQMKRELKRAQEEIKNIDQEASFSPVKKFNLAVDERRIKTYDTSHVKSEDALIYDRLGEEPLALQNLLYYFSRQDVPHGTVFWEFLNEVNRVLHMQRKRTVLVERLRKLALTLAIICYVVIGIMFCLLITSTIMTITKMNDAEVQWSEPTMAAPFLKIVQTR